MNKTNQLKNSIIWPLFAVGCICLLFAMCLAIWGFWLGNLTRSQHFILLFAFPLATGFAASSFTGSLKVAGPIGSFSVGTVGGFAVWLLTFYLLPDPFPKSDIHGFNDNTNLTKEMVYIPSVGEPSLHGFYLGKHEVTFSEYDDFCNQAGCEKPDSAGLNRGQYPVFNVSFADAKGFASWLSKKEKRKYRLPTAQEWEYACGVSGRGGNFPWGKESSSKVAEQYAVYLENSFNHAHPVGSKISTGIGQFSLATDELYDLAGNVWEWVDPPPIPEKNSGVHMLAAYKGGSFSSSLQDLRCDILILDQDMSHSPKIGFRLLMED